MPSDRRRPRLRQAQLAAADAQSQGRVLTEDRPLQLAEPRARLEPQFVRERLACRLVPVERLCLPACAIEREEQQAVEALPERVLANERVELPDQLGIAPEREPRLDPELDRVETRLLEPGALRGGGSVQGEAVQRRSAPESESLVEKPGRGAWIAGRELGPRALDEPPEASKIDLSGRRLEHVSRAAAHDAVPPERAAQPVHVDLQRVHGPRRRPLSP